jgi:hypothetical protein
MATRLIQTPQGKFAWCVVGKDKFEQFGVSFAKLVEKYVAYRQFGDGRPFNSYGR